MRYIEIRMEGNSGEGSFRIIIKMPGLIKAVSRKIRKNLNRYPIKDYEPAPVNKTWTLQELTAASNIAYYYQYSMYTMVEVTNRLKAVTGYDYNETTGAIDTIDMEIDEKAEAVPQASIAAKAYGKTMVRYKRSTYWKITMRNNDTVSCYVRFYEYVPKDTDDTTDKPNVLTYLNNGFQQYTNSTSAVTLNTGTQYFHEYPTTVEHTFNEEFERVKPVKTVFLPPWIVTGKPLFR